MSKDPSKDNESAPEYDFSKGVRGKYVERLGGPNPSWIGEMAKRDTQRWIAETLLRFQRLEGNLVAYFALVHDQSPSEAGVAATQALEDPRSRFFVTLLRDLKRHPETTEDLTDRLSGLFNERNWLVHRAFHSSHYTRHPDDFVTRVSAAATEASRADSTLYRFLLARCEALGISVRDAETKAAAVIEEWAAA